MLDKSISKFRKVLLKSYVETEPFVQEVGHFDVTTEGAILGVSRNFLTYGILLFYTLRSTQT